MKINFKNIGFIIIVVGVLVFLTCKNWNDNDFFNANIVQLLTFALTSFISFFFVQHLTDKRRKVDCIIKIINDINNCIQHDTILFSSEREALILQESIANRIKYISDYGFKEISEDITYITVKFTELRNLYSDHSSSEENLLSVKSDFTRNKNHISNRCVKIQLKLYDI